MDKLNWFKFTPSDWVMGKIQRTPEITQARFMRLICLYWNKECCLSVEDAEIEIDKDHLDLLISKKIIKSDGQFLNIQFLDEQFLGITEEKGFKSKSGLVGNLKRWHKSIYDDYCQGKIDLETAISMSKPSHPDRTPIAEQSQIIADKIRLDKIRDTYINNSLMSEIKISDDEKFFIVKGKEIEPKGNDIQYFRIAEAYRRIFIKNLTEKQAPCANQRNAKFSTYVNPIKHMIEIDEVSIDQIRDASNYLKSKEGEFWKSNILSTKKLREKISVLLAKKNEVKSNTQKGDFKDIPVPDPNKRNKI